MIASVVGASPCLPMAPMNSPLFYELDGGGYSSTSRSDVCDKLKDSATTVASSSASSSRSSRPLRLNLNGGGGGVAAGSGVRGLAPIRVSNAVFGNARAGLAELESPSYVELADINTPEISLDLQVTTLNSSFFVDVINACLFFFSFPKVISKSYLGFLSGILIFFLR